MNWTENRIINSLFVVALSIIIILGVNSYQAFQRKTESDRRLLHTHHVVEASEAILSNMKDCETGARGYIITGKEEFLQPFTNAYRRNDALLRDFTTLTADNRSQLARAARLRSFIAQKFSYSRYFIQQRREKGMLPTEDQIRMSPGKSIMDSIRSLVSRINREEKQLMAQRQQLADQADAASRTFLFVGTLTSAVLFIGIFFALHNQISRRKKNERKLFVQNEWYNQTLVSLGDGVITIDPNGVITMMNRSASEISGWSNSEATGKFIEDVFVITNETTGKKVFNPALRALETNKVSFLENHTYLHRKDGSKLYIDDSGAPIHNAEGETVGAVLIFRDVTERKVAERERNMFFNISVDMIGIADQSGYFTRINPAFHKTLGHSDEEFLSKSFVEYIHHDDLESTANELKRLAQGLLTHNFKNRYRCSDGTYKWLEWNVTPVGDTLYAIGRDATERHELAQKMQDVNDSLEKKVGERTRELENQKKFTDDILNKIPAGITVFDRNRKYLYVNSEIMADEEDKKAIIGKDDTYYCKIMKYDEATIAKRKLIFDRFIKRSENLEWVDRVTDLEGRTKYLLRKLQLLSDKEKFLLISYDITEIKQSEMQKQQYTKALEEMMFITSHKVRNDVSRLMSIAELLNLSVTSEELAQIIGHTSDSINSLDKTTEDLTLFIHEQKRN